MTISFRLEAPDFKIGDVNMDRVTKDLVKEATEYTYTVMLDEAPERTGKLKESIKRKHRGLRGEVYVGVPYAAFVELGTRPHIIRPVHAQTLRFEVGGEVIFTRLVRHPGTKPDPFIKRTEEKVLRRINPLFIKVIGKAMKTGVLR